MVLALALWWLVGVADVEAFADAWGELMSAPGLLGIAVIGYAAAFGIRALAWTRVQPGLSPGQAWAAIHVSLLGNHVLPLRLGEILRVTSVLRRTDLSARDVVAGVLVLRLGDLLALLAIAAVATPVVLLAILGLAVSIAVGVLLACGLGAAWWWSRAVAADRDDLRPPGLVVAAATVAAWLSEAVVLLAVAQSAGLSLSVPQAAGVTAVTVFAQVVAITPGGFGTYEAAGTAALVTIGVGPADAFAVILLTHAVKTAYSLILGGVALFAPAPGYWGRWRLPRDLPQRPPALPGSAGPDAPVVVFLPAHNEEDVIASVLRRIPERAHGHRVEVFVIDDGSVDATAERAACAGAEVIRLGRNQGLGAAVRRGLAAAAERRPVAGVYLDADGEYPPEEIPAVVTPVLEGDADYVIGSRFAGTIETMRPHRRIGNLVLTRWVRWMTRRRDLTDGQSGFRAFSPAALDAAEVVHDYNYAQVLTLDLLAKGFVYAEVPISYRFRTTGTSFVSLGRYLRMVLPAVHRELNPQKPSQMRTSSFPKADTPAARFGSAHKFIPDGRHADGSLWKCTRVSFRSGGTLD